jgi:uncharacterized membrane protein YhiD involved in acid resistance
VVVNKVFSHTKFRLLFKDTEEKKDDSAEQARKVVFLPTLLTFQQEKERLDREKKEKEEKEKREKEEREKREREEEEKREREEEEKRQLEKEKRQKEREEKLVKKPVVVEKNDSERYYKNYHRFANKSK